MQPLVIQLLVGGLVIALGVAVALRLPGMWRKARRMSDGPEPRCRGCGYVICQGAGRTCPECGGDLRKLGVISTSLSRPTYPLALIIGGGVMLTALALPGGILLSAYVPPLFSDYQAVTSIPTGIPASQPSGSPDVIEVTARGHRAVFNHPPRDFGITWFRFQDGGMGWIAAAYTESPRAWALEWTPGSSRREFVAEFDEKLARRFVTHAGLDPDSTRAKELESDMLEALQSFRRGEMPSYRSTVPSRDPHYGPTEPAMMYYSGDFPRNVVLSFLLWLLLWWPLRHVLRRRWRRDVQSVLAEEQSVLNELGVPA